MVTVASRGPSTSAHFERLSLAHYDGRGRSGPTPHRSRDQVSVLVPTHNDGDNIGPLLRRLLDDPCVGEVLVLASECTDHTVRTVVAFTEEAGGRLRLYVEERRSGKALAVNFGISQATLALVVIVSGDVLPEPGALGRLAQALRIPGVGLAGGRPVPVNEDHCLSGHAAQLLWRLHHGLALHQPKLGEMLALRAEAVVALPPTSVDEATFQALLESVGWRSVYVPDALVSNRGPGTLADFVKQRRQVHAGHLWLRHHRGYIVPSLRPRLVLKELARLLRNDRHQRGPIRLCWTAATIAMEAWARFGARLDYLRGKENHVWTMVESAKAPALGPHGVLTDRRHLVAGEEVGRGCCRSTWWSAPTIGVISNAPRATCTSAKSPS